MLQKYELLPLIKFYNLLVMFSAEKNFPYFLNYKVIQRFIVVLSKWSKVNLYRDTLKVLIW